MQHIKSILVLALSMLALAGYAANETSKEGIAGTDIVTGASFEVEDNKFFVMQNANWSEQFANKKAFGRIVLKVDHNIASLEKYQVEVEIEVTPVIYSSEGFESQATESITLSVGYDPSASINYQDIHFRQFSGAYKLEIEVVDVRDAETDVSITAPANLALEATIMVERYYHLDVHQYPANINSAFIAPTNELEIFWDYLPGAEEYDLEWTFVNDLNADPNGNITAISANQLKYDFKGNSTRITTTSNSYRIPLIYERGYLLYRVRGVSRWAPEYTQRKVGAWSSLNNTGTVSAFADRYYIGNAITDGYANTMNWQYSASYAEEGKKKVVVSFFDGSLRNRQTVTKSNTEEEAIVGETIYDHQGRAGIQVLPVPVHDSIIAYYPQLNKNMAGETYSRKDFDVDADPNSCVSGVNPMDPVSGASNYYSPQNPDKEGHQAFVPDANGYPFTQTEYTPDNTGRIRRQSGVGPNHQLGTNHETKYFYGKPLQLQLDRLFGSEVGYANHYKKNMVIDPNGQVSVSYLDMQGRVIATSLAGEVPNNVQALPSEADAAVEMTVDLLGKDNSGNGTENIRQDDALLLNTILMVPTAGDHEFHYDMTGESIDEECLEDACYDCVYDLTIDVKDECGTSVLQNPVTKTIGDNPAEDDANAKNCDSAGRSYDSDLDAAAQPFMADLAVGTYNLTKKLAVNPDALDYYTDVYINDDTCLLTYEDFLEEEWSFIDTTECNTNCDDCVANLGTKEEFVANGGTEAAYDRQVEECMEPCKYTSLCEISYEMMLSDVTPGGQYAKFWDAAAAVDNMKARKGATVTNRGKNHNTDKYPLSILNEYNLLPDRPDANWRNPFTDYRDRNGYIEYITLTNIGGGVYFPEIQSGVTPVEVVLNEYGSYELCATTPCSDPNYVLAVKPGQLKNVQDFINRFKKEWAESLVPYHPEYCYYEWCSGNGEIQGDANLSSDGFDSLLLVIDNYNDAFAAGLIRPGNGTYLILNEDPYFNGGLGAGQKATVQSQMGNYNGSNLTMLQYATAITLCPAYYGDPMNYPQTCLTIPVGVPADEELRDQIWNGFKMLYTSEKQKMQQRAAEKYAQDNYCFNGCIEEDQFNPFKFRFGAVWGKRSGDPDYADDIKQPCYYTTYRLYENKTVRFRTAEDIVSNDLYILGEGDNTEELEQMIEDMEYEMWLRTGQCPLTLDLQYFLDEHGRRGELPGSHSLMSYGSLTPRIYEAFGGDLTEADNFTWNGSVSGANLSITITSPGAAKEECLDNSITLTLSDASYSWSDLTGFRNIKFQKSANGLHEFNITGLIDADGDPATAPAEVLVTGQTCLPIADCEFSPYKCKKTTDASDVEMFLSGMAAEDELTNLIGNLTQIPLAAFLTNNLRSYIGGGALEWERTVLSGSRFEGRIKKQNGTGKEMYFVLEGLTGYNYSQIEYFSGFSLCCECDPSGINTCDVSLKSFPEPYESTSFYITAHIGNNRIELSGTVALLNSEGTGFSLGGCEERAVSSLQCETQEHYNRIALEETLHQLAVNDELTATSQNLNEAYPSFSATLYSYFGTGNWQWTDVNIDGTSLSADIKNSAGEIGCSVFLSFSNEGTPYDFDDIIGFTDLEVLEFDMINGRAYDFRATALIDSDDNGEADKYEEISGASCFPIKDCDVCIEEGYEGINLVVNGDFENQDMCTMSTGNSCDTYNGSCSMFSSDYPYTGIETLCSCSDVFTFIQNGEDLENMTSCEATIPFTGLDHTEPGQGHFMYLNWSEKAGKKIAWSQTITDIEPGKEYQFKAWFMFPFLVDESCDICPRSGDTTGCEVELYVNGTLYGSLNMGMLSAQWQEAEAIWQAGPADTEAILEIKYGGCNDEYDWMLGIDDISFKGKGCPSNDLPNLDSLRVPYEDPCVEYLTNIAEHNAKMRYEDYIDSAKAAFRDRYIEKCLSAAENFTMNYTDKEFHYTLYYYDQAGNLIKTVPPAGMNPLPITSYSDALSAQIRSDREIGHQTVFTDHTMSSLYHYNSLNQLRKQRIPDHDPMDIWEFSLTSGIDPAVQITATQFVNESKGYLTGYKEMTDGRQRGYLYTTEDGGRTWQRITNVAAHLQKVQMVTADIGYATGSHGIILKTIDGGDSWDMLPLYDLNILTTINDLYFQDEDEGVFVGDNGIALKTTDGGASFTRGTGFVAGDNITAITYDGSDYYASVANGLTGKVYNSADALAWTEEIACLHLSIEKAYMIDGSNGFAAGEYGFLLSTTDGGESWAPVPNELSGTFKDIHFYNMQEGVAIVENNSIGELWHTADGGYSWTRHSTDNESFHALDFYEADRGIAVGSSGMVERLKYTGQTIERQRIDNGFTSTELQTVSANLVNDKAHIAAGGSNGNIYYTKANRYDSQTEQWQHITAGADFKKIIIAPVGAAFSGVAVTQAGNLYSIYRATADDAYTVQSFSAPTGVNIADAALGANNTVYAFDNTGKQAYKIVLQETAATTSAAALEPGNNISTANGIAVVERNLPPPPGPTPRIATQRLFVVGEEGEIYKGQIAGLEPNRITWSAKTYDAAAAMPPLNDIEAEQTGYIYAAGNKGFILGSPDAVTQDGCWDKVATGTATRLNALRFTDDAALGADGLLTGDAGKLWKVQVSGNSFALTVQTTGTTANLYEVAYNSPELYVTGASGNVLYTYDINAASLAQQGDGSARTYRGAYFKPGSSEVFITGDNSFVYRYNNGLRARVDSLFTPALRDVHFTTTTNGYVAGDNFTLRHTQNGGSTWSIALPADFAGGVPELNAVWTTAAGTAVTAGEDGYIANVNNTAVTENAASGTAGETLRAMSFSSATEGYIAGGNGSSGIYKATADGGQTWNNGTATLANTTFNGIHAFANNTFMAVGTGGKIAYYNGTALATAGYEPPADYAAHDYNDVFFRDHRQGYVAGDAGVLLKAATEDVSTGVTWLNKRTTDKFGVDDSTAVDIKTVDFPTATEGFLGGSLPSLEGPGVGYTRLIRDESGRFSTLFWYDRLGRLVLSQNTKQYSKEPSAYSYTLYDAQGRITEVGEKAENTPLPGGAGGGLLFADIFGENVNGFTNQRTINDAKFRQWIEETSGARTEVTQTYYDRPVAELLPGFPDDFEQENLRKRVATITYEDIYDGDPLTFEHGTHYTYDIHGNVNTLLQDNKAIVPDGLMQAGSIQEQRFKRIDYDYDLVSGNVKQVSYQHGKPDAFYHRYEYDADNRITHVYTSSSGAVMVSGDEPAEGVILSEVEGWDLEARYEYYKHGPLARVEYGDNKVQGVDYAYTLLGWIKGVNSNTLDPARDIGEDGNPVPNNPNANFGRDVMGYTLGYYETDYTAIQGLKWNNAEDRFEAVTTGSQLYANRSDLWNGNISHMVTTITNPETGEILPNAYAYRYDQLNRIKETRAFNNLDAVTNTWSTGTTTYDGRYENQYDYDPNGNMTTVQVKNATGELIDDQTYHYQTMNGRRVNNRLYAISDNAVITTGFDIESGQIVYDNNAPNQTNNYGYNAVGSITKDKQDEIEKIIRRTDEKIKEIIRESGSTRANLKFRYNGLGNVVMMEVYTSDNQWLYTEEYVRDAQGNIMATYLHQNDTETQTQSYKVIERHIYGSSSIGIDKEEIELIGAVPVDATEYTRTLGYKQYSLKNHLGNVLTTISDKKIAVDDGTGGIAYYKASIVSAKDYGIFGEYLESRVFNADAYPNSFNDKRDLIELDGWQDYGFRNYMKPERRFERVDDLFKKFPWWSTYQFAGGNPIENIDLDGKEPFSFKAYQLNSPLTLIQKDTDYKIKRFQNSRAGKITMGALNTTMGIVGTVSSVVYISSTGGTGAAVGGVLALELSLGETVIGIMQIAEASFNNGDNKRAQIIHRSSTIPGLFAYATESEYAPFIDAVGGISPYALTLQSPTELVTGGMGILDALRKFGDNPNVLRGLNLIDQWMDVKGFAVESVKLIGEGENQNLEANFTYTVQNKDVLSKIAKKFNTTVEKIAEDNNIENIHVIKAGQELNITYSTSDDDN